MVKLNESSAGQFLVAEKLEALKNINAVITRTISGLQDELAGLSEKYDQALATEATYRREIRHLESEVSALTSEVDALRSSMSWRLMAPVRTVVGFLIRFKRL